MLARLPNALSALRLVLAPVGLALAYAGLLHAYLVALAVALVSDVVDGPLARRLGVASERGARLDSAADFATYATVPLCAWWLDPDLVRAEAAAIGLLVAGYLVPVAIGLVRFRRLTSYHTVLARVAAQVAGPAAVVALAGGPSLPLRAAAVLVAVSGIEEIGITFVLPEWRSNVPSLYTVLVRRAAP